jgi:RNA polymerase sigma factor (sigma-70 family)
MATIRGITMTLDELFIKYKADARKLNPLLTAITQHVTRVAPCLDSRLTHDQAQDTAQNVTLAVFQSLSRFDEKVKFSTLVHTITKNAVIDWRRRLESNPQHHAAGLIEEPDDDVQDDPTERVTKRPATKLTSDDSSERLLDAVKGHLTLSQVNLLLAGYTVQEVAEREGISVNVLRNRIARLRKANLG